MNNVEDVIDWVINIADIFIPSSNEKESSSTIFDKADCLTLLDMAEWFHQFKLTKGKDVPVVIDGNTEFGNVLLEKLQEAEIFDTSVQFDAKGYFFIVGSFNKETNAFEHAVIYTADEIDQQLKEVFEGKDIIALQ